MTEPQRNTWQWGLTRRLAERLFAPTEKTEQPPTKRRAMGALPPTPFHNQQSIATEAEQERDEARRGAVQERKWREAAEQERDEAVRLLGILKESLAYEQAHKTDLADIATAAYQRSLSRHQEDLAKAEDRIKALEGRIQELERS